MKSLSTHINESFVNEATNKNNSIKIFEETFERFNERTRIHPAESEFDIYFAMNFNKLFSKDWIVRSIYLDDERHIAFKFMVKKYPGIIFNASIGYWEQNGKFQTDGGISTEQFDSKYRNLTSMMYKSSIDPGYSRRDFHNTIPLDSKQYMDSKLITMDKKGYNSTRMHLALEIAAPSLMQAYKNAAAEKGNIEPKFKI